MHSKSLPPLDSGHSNGCSPLPHVDEKLSHAYGRSSNELKYYTLAPLVDATSKCQSDNLAVVFHDEGLSKSFEQLNTDINRLVNGMVYNLGLRHGDRVGLYSYNTYQFLLIQYACNKLGLTLNPINPSYKSHEFTYVLGKADVKVLFMPGKNSRQSSLNDHWSVICDESLGELQNEGGIKHFKEIVLLDGDLDEKDLKMKNIIISRWQNVFYDNSTLDSTVQEIIGQVQSDDIYGIYYTSGTTGFPKGAVVTQFTVLNNVRLTSNRLFNERGPNFLPVKPILCIPLPLFHEFAGVLGALLPFFTGSAIVFPGIRYSIQAAVESIIEYNCNAIYLTPTILIDLLNYVEEHNIADILPLKIIFIAGSTVMPELVNRTHTILTGLEELRIGYGSSENGVITTMQTSQEPEESRPFNVGTPLDFTEIRIADIETGETTLHGVSGEVQTRGYITMLCYYNDPEKTSEVITNSRWYRTGDLGVIDKRGSLRLVGRIKDLIIKGGENVYPAEVETVLHYHDAIEDAHVFGVPDKRYGEEVCAWIKLKNPNQHLDVEVIKGEILDFCRRKLTYFKVPKHVMFVKEFPLTSVKKIKKFEMRAQTTKMLNLDEK